MGERKVIEWTEAHQREATARQWEIAAGLHRAGKDTDAHYLGHCPSVDAESEKRWCAALAEAGFDSARIDREVRRVDGLATGRLVRDTVWLVGGKRCHGGEMKARMVADQTGAKVTRRARIRRAK